MDMPFHEFLRYTKTHISNIQKIMSVIPFIPKMLGSATFTNFSLSFVPSSNACIMYSNNFLSFLIRSLY